MSHETPNIITLGSLTYIVDGQVTVQPASAWAEGIRSGSPDYGDVNHAQFRVTEDFRGGMGVKFGKDREDLDVMAESQGVRTWLTRNGFDLAPIMSQGTIGAISPSYLWRNFPMQQHIVDGQNFLWGAAGNTVMRYGSTLSTWVKDSPSGIAISGAAGINNAYCLYEYTNTNGSSHLYWGAGYVSSNLTKVDVDFYRRSESTPIADVDAWAQPSAGEKAHDFLEFDKKILKLYFGQVKSSEDGITWTDLNIDIPSPPSQLAAHRSKFVGRAETVSGELMPVVLRSRKLYWVDIFAQDYAEIETGMGSSVVDATIYQDEIAATDNNSVKLIHPRRPIRDIGLPSLKDGFLDDANDFNAAFLKLFTWGPYLLAYVNMAGGSTESMQIWLFNGSGWHGLSAFRNGTVANTVNGGNSGIAAYTGQNIVASGKEIWTMGAKVDGDTILVNQIPTAATILHATLTPKFYATGEIITPWFSGGFKNMIGTAIELTMSARNLDAGNEEILVEYQIDGVETSWLTTKLGSNGPGAGIFSVSPQETIKFGEADAGSGQGIKFEDIRFKFTLSRGGTITKTPIFLGMVLSYVKTPKLRRRYQFAVDVALTAQHREPVASNTRVTYESIVDELYGFIAADPLTPFSYTNESLKWVRVIGMPRQDALAPPADDNYSRVLVDLIEPVGV